MEPVRVSTIDDYVLQVLQIARTWSDDENYIQPWFRGVRCESSFKLLPRLYRDTAIKWLDAEEKMRVAFMSRAAAFVEPTRRRDEWDWYFLMQHYGVPTRLLDWTESALIALYFALTTRANEFTESPAVWVLNPLQLNKCTIDREQVIGVGDSNLAEYLPQRSPSVTAQLPVALQPNYTDRRILAQQSKFTIHGRSMTPLEEIPELEGLRLDGHLQKVIISMTDSDVSDRLKELALLGILHSTVFPDLQGLSQDIAGWYTTLT